MHEGNPMKQLLTLLVLLAMGAAIKGETFLGVTSATNRLTVGTNEAIIITRLSVQNDGEYQLVKDGNIHRLYGSTEGLNVLTPNNPGALTGPCELILTNKALVNFRRIPSASLQTFVLAPSATTNTAQVTLAMGQAVRLFKPFPIFVYNTRNISVSRGTNEFDIYGAVEGYGNEEFNGPLALTFRGPTSGPYSFIFSIAILDDAQVVPQGVTVQSATGASQLVVEKSINLTNWTPSVFQDLNQDQKAFFRLRVTK